jgi:hypothetical protein
MPSNKLSIEKRLHTADIVSIHFLVYFDLGQRELDEYYKLKAKRFSYATTLWRRQP